MTLEGNAIQRCDAVLLWFRGQNTAQIAKVLGAKESAVANALAHIFDRCHSRGVGRNELRVIAASMKAGLAPTDTVL